MTTLRFRPPSSGPLANAGRIEVASNWDPAQAPQAGDSAIVTGGTLYVREQTLSGLGLFAFTTTIYTGTGPDLEFRNVTLASGTTLVVEGDFFVGTGVGLSGRFENDGRIELSNSAGFGGADGYSFVNKGTIVLDFAEISPNTTIENDGVVEIRNPFSLYTYSFGGNGTVIVAPGSKLTLSVGSSTQKVVLEGGTAAHTTLANGNLAAPIAGFVSGDSITDSGFYGAVTQVTYVNTGAHAGTLTVNGTNGGIEQVKFLGDYTAADFTVAVSPQHVLSITTSRTDGAVDAATAIYRFFDTIDGTHFFTASTSERDSIVNTRPDLSFEGATFAAADPNGAAAAPIYRFFDNVHGTHFYTADAAERDAVRASRPDLVAESTAFSEHRTAQSGDAPVYRFFDSTYGTHFYTGDASEAASIGQTRPDLVAEGIAFYAPHPA